MNAPTFVATSCRESADNYSANVVRSGRWRIIEGRCGIQWVLQYQARLGAPDTVRWEGRHYFSTRPAAIRLWRQFTGEEGAALAAVLPERFPRGARHDCN